MQLSPNFTLQEFTQSGTASRLGIDNTPDQAAILCMEALCDNVLEPIRAHFGRPVIIPSGYRCPELNKAVGGASGSQHVKGEAADIRVHKVPHVDVIHFILDHLDFDQLIAEHLKKADPHAGWIHVSFSLVKLRRYTLSCINTGQGNKYEPGIVLA
jgi:zinc D-Ala-D-Ala carboxypeptidase